MTCDTSLQSELWHWRFSHLRYKALLDARKMVTGLSKFKVDHEGFCQGCVAGKHTRGPFPSNESKTTNILQLIHSDLSGMLPITSLGEYLYYAIFVDASLAKHGSISRRRRMKCSNGSTLSKP